MLIPVEVDVEVVAGAYDTYIIFPKWKSYMFSKVSVPMVILISNTVGTAALPVVFRLIKTGHVKPVVIRLLMSAVEHVPVG